MIAKDLCKQLALDSDSKAIQQINFPGNSDLTACAEMFFIIEEAEKNILDFSQRTVKVLQFYFILI